MLALGLSTAQAFVPLDLAHSDQQVQDTRVFQGVSSKSAAALMRNDQDTKLYQEQPDEDGQQRMVRLTGKRICLVREDRRLWCRPFCAMTASESR